MVSTWKTSTYFLFRTARQSSTYIALNLHSMATPINEEVAAPLPTTPPQGPSVAAITPPTSPPTTGAARIARAYDPKAIPVSPSRSSRVLPRAPQPVVPADEATQEGAPAQETPPRSPKQSTFCDRGVHSTVSSHGYTGRQRCKYVFLFIIADWN